MKNKRKMVVTTLVVLFVLGGAHFAFQADSMLGRTALGDGQIGKPVSDSEGEDLVGGGCAFMAFLPCGISSSCTHSCYVGVCFNFINTAGTPPCGGSCGTYTASNGNCGGG